jgi:hypothetical protein
LEEHSELFDKTSRNRLIRKVVEDTGKPRIYYIRQLRRYWQRGMTPNALLSDYHKSGAKGKPRRNIDNKLGRKRTTSEGVGVIINNDVAEIFRLAIDGFFLQNDKFSIKDAKDKAIGLYKSRFPDSDKTSVPTLRQFRYFYETNYRKHDVVRQRTPSKIYDKDIRAFCFHTRSGGCFKQIQDSINFISRKLKEEGIQKLDKTKVIKEAREMEGKLEDAIDAKKDRLIWYGIFIWINLLLDPIAIILKS